MRVWTRQAKAAWEDLERTGRLTARRRHAENKYGDGGDLMLVCYDWLARETEKHLDRPGGAQAPLWLALRPDFLPCPYPDSLVLELEMPRDRLLTFDMGKWDYILNYWYIPLDEADKQAFRRDLSAKGVRNQSEAVMTAFHPVLKRRIMESWSRLFDGSIRISDNDQAICWEIRREWVVAVDGRRRTPQG